MGLFDLFKKKRGLQELLKYMQTENGRNVMVNLPPQILVSKKLIKEKLGFDLTDEELKYFHNKWNEDDWIDKVFNGQKGINMKKEKLEQIANEIAEIRLRLPASDGYLDNFIKETRHYGSEINDFNDMVFVAEKFVQITKQKGREASIRDIEYAWDGIAGWKA